MKDGKTVSQRIREYVAMERLSDDYLAAAAVGSQRVAFVRGMSAMADEIEAEIEEARRTPKAYEEFLSLLDVALERPLNDGESIKAWLDRNYIAIPTDKDGMPWAIGDVCLVDGGTMPGKVIGYDVTEGGDVAVVVVVGCGDDSYDASMLSRVEEDSQEAIEDDATMCPGAYCAEHGIDLGDDPDRERATIAMVCDLLRRQRELDVRQPC